MEYLLIKLLPYLMLSLGMGLFVGWFSCRRADH